MVTRSIATVSLSGTLEEKLRAIANAEFDAVEIFPRSVRELDSQQLKSCLIEHRLKLAAVGTGFVGGHPLVLLPR